MTNTYLLDPVKILSKEQERLSEGAVLVIDKRIKAFGENARDIARKHGFKQVQARNKIFAPCLVDPHSILQDPLNGFSETLVSLRHKASLAGYGQIAILPRGLSWRDRPERLQGFSNPNENVLIHLWGSFSLEGYGKDLSPHKDLIDFGAIGLAEDDSILSSEIMQKGFLLGQMGHAPVLFAPRDKGIQGNGILREGVETLRAGFVPDPFASETIPIKVLLELQEQHPEINLRLMNLSTAKGVSILSNSPIKPMASVSWWHLLADTSQIELSGQGLRICPSLGGAKDRNKLIEGLQKRIITGVAVHAIPLEQAEIKKPTDQRSPGICGHDLVLPSLWKELVEKRNWTVEQLWEALSFGPSKILNFPPEELKLESNRWLLF